ncbi:MAG: imidazole glycerol phosphate synthase subunit HisH [Chloroflexota bacterium]
MRLLIIDYGAGNLRSVAKAFTHLGVEPTVSESARALDQAQAIVLPGVGAAGDAMQALRSRGLVQPIRDYVASGRPFFGVCLGMQVLLSISDEDGEQPCLDVVSGRVRRLPNGLKVPQMGWNQVRQRTPHPLFKDIPDDTNFYFVHSYYCDPSDATLAIGTTEYGLEYCSVLARDNLVATQFHPEKSSRYGLQLYRNFLDMAQIQQPLTA